MFCHVFLITLKYVRFSLFILLWFPLLFNYEIIIFSHFILNIQAISLLVLTSAEIYDTSKYTLGNNLVINGQFDDTSISNSVVYPGSMTGWSCTPQCEVQNTNDVCTTEGQPCIFNWVQAIDTNSNTQFDLIATLRTSLSMALSKDGREFWSSCQALLRKDCRAPVVSTDRGSTGLSPSRAAAAAERTSAPDAPRSTWTPSCFRFATSMRNGHLRRAV